MGFVNHKYGIVDMKTEPVYSSFQEKARIHKIREKLWDNAKVISEFIRSDNDLTGEEISLLRLWEKHHIKGRFVILKYEPEYAVFNGIITKL